MRHKLIRMRRKAMMTQEDAAYRAGLARSSLARYETGAQRPGMAACRKLARVYQVSFDELVDAIEATSDLPSLREGWWTNYEVFEQSAVRIRTWQPMVCPGLLQVEGYARALLGGDEEMVERRLARQALLTRDHEPAQLMAVLDESTLHRQVGGAGNLARQLDHLLAMGGRRNITIQILPLLTTDLAVALGCRGAFEILQPSWPGGMVHLEHAGGARNLDQPAELEAHGHEFRQLQGAALSPAESKRLIRQRREDLDR